MFEFTKNVLLSGQFKIGQGEISLLGQSISLLPTETMATITIEMSKNGQASTLYETFAGAIPPFVQALKKRHVVELLPLVKLMVDIAITGGWGETKLIEYKDKEHKYLFTVNNAPIPKIIGKSEKETCHMMRGLIGGSMREIVNDKALDCIEIKCVARGAPLCQFIVQPRKSFDAATFKEFGWQIEDKSGKAKTAKKSK